MESKELKRAIELLEKCLPYVYEHRNRSYQDSLTLRNMSNFLKRNQPDNDDQNHISDASKMVSLRDQFAGQAMQGIVSNSSAMTNLGEAGERELVDPDLLLSAAAYAIADAMLKEQSK